MLMTDWKLSKNILERIKKIIKKIEWFFDIYFVWMLYSPRKYDRYNEYIGKKWGKNE
jgi:HJR/Mrr/RecB family endonuclease